jgi:hypothetical protein
MVIRYAGVYRIRYAGVYRIRYAGVYRIHVKSQVINPWSKVLFEKLNGCQLVKIFPAFYGTRRFITAFTNARQLSLS